MLNSQSLLNSIRILKEGCQVGIQEVGFKPFAFQQQEIVPKAQLVYPAGALSKPVNQEVSYSFISLFFFLIGKWVRLLFFPYWFLHV